MFRRADRHMTPRERTSEPMSKRDELEKLKKAEREALQAYKAAAHARYEAIDALDAASREEQAAFMSWVDARNALKKAQKKGRRK